MDFQHVSRLVSRTILEDNHANLLSHREIRTPGSLVFRLEYASREGSRILFVKTPAEGKNASQTTKSIERLIKEFEVTELVSSALESTTELETVSPAGFIDEINGFVTWEASGNSLQDLINSSLGFRCARESPEIRTLRRLTGRAQESTARTCAIPWALRSTPIFDPRRSRVSM
jgi:hypothetical protein